MPRATPRQRSGTTDIFATLRGASSQWYPLCDPMRCACGLPAVVELVVTNTWRYRAGDHAPKRVKEIVARLGTLKQHGVATTFYCESCLQTVGEVSFPSK